MPFGFDINVDMKKNQLLNVLAQILAADPGSPTEGNFYYNNVDHTLHFYNGTAWIVLGRLDQITAPTASVSMNSQKITGLAAPAAGTDAVNRDYVLGRTVNDLTAPATDFAMNSHKITGLSVPTADGDAATRGYILGLKVSDLTALAADWSVNSHKITSLSDGTNANDAINKQQLDAAIAGLKWKQSVRAATTAAGTLATSFANGQTIDTVTLVTGDRILIKNQASGFENGIYVVAASGAPTRATDADSAAEITNAAAYVSEGSTNGNSGWANTTDAPITLASTPTVWAQFTGGAATVAGAGMTLTGSTVDIIAAASPGTGGPGGGLVVAADSIAIDKDHVVEKYATDVGGATSVVVTHNLGTLDVTVAIFDKSTPFSEVHCEVQHTSTNTITLLFSVAPGAAAYRCVVHG